MENQQLSLMDMGIPTRKWAKMAKVDLDMKTEGQLGSANAILPWGYLCLFCKIDGFSEICLCITVSYCTIW